MDTIELEGVDVYTRIKWLNEQGLLVIFGPNDDGDNSVSIIDPYVKHSADFGYSADGTLVEAFNEAEAQAMKRIKEE